MFVSFVSFSQEKRLALVIGNSSYDKGELKNPVNDAKLIARTLDSLGFDVIEAYDLETRRSFLEVINEFGDKRDSVDVGFVYYAGHGVQIKGENFLLPIKENFSSENEVVDFGVSVQRIMQYLENKTDQVNILVLDACRDNPFESNWKTTRSLKNDGLAKIPPPTGSLIAFSTDAGKTAADGGGDNSVYTKSLAKNMLLEDVNVDQVFRNVRTEVLNSTNGEQRPVEFTQLTGQEFFLNPGNYEDEFEAIEIILDKSDGGELNALSILEPILKETPNNLRAIVYKARIYMRLKEYSKSLEEFDKAINIDSANPIIYYYRTGVYENTEDFDKALLDYNKLVELVPEDPDYYYYRGQFYENYLQDFNKALLDYGKAIELKSEDPDLYFARAILFQNNLEQYDKALTDYYKIEKINPYYPYLYNNIAGIYVNYFKAYLKALEYYTKSIELSPIDPTAYRNRADLYSINLKDNDKALLDYNKVVELAPEDSESYYHRGLFYENYLQDYDKALLDYDKAIEHNPGDPDIYFVRAYLYRNYFSKPEKALENYFKVVELRPNHQSVYNNIANIYRFYIKDYQNALKYYTKSLVLSPNNPLTYRNRGELYSEKLEDFDKALIDYNSAVELAPEDADAYYYRGQFHNNYLKNYNKALLDYNKAIELNSTDLDYYFARANVYEEIDEHNKTIENYLKVLELDPNNYAAFNNVGLIYNYEIKDFDKSLEYYTKSIELSPNDPLAYQNRGQLYSENLKDNDKALLDYNKVVELAPEDSESYYYRGEFYRNHLQDHDKALLDYNKAIELNPEDPKLFFANGFLYAEINKQNKALENYLKVVELDTTYLNIYNNIALVYENYIKDYTKAIEYYTKNIELSSSEPIAYINRANLYSKKLEDTEKALSDYNKAIELAPKDSDFYFYRGEFYEDYFQDHDQALLDYNKAIELNPQDAALFFNRTTVYENLQQYDLAIKDYYKTIEIDSGYAYTSYKYIGKLYWENLDNLDLAEEYLTKSINLNNEAETFQLRGLVYQAKGEYNKALTDLNKAIELEPENKDLYYYRLNYYVVIKDQDAAIKEAKHTIEQDRDDPQGYYVLALIYNESESYFKALTYLTTSIEKLDKGGYIIISLDGKGLVELLELYKFRADIFKKLGGLDMLCEDYNTALELTQKGSENRKEIEALIQENCSD